MATERAVSMRDVFAAAIYLRLGETYNPTIRAAHAYREADEAIGDMDAIENWIVEQEEKRLELARQRAEQGDYPRPQLDQHGFSARD